MSVARRVLAAAALLVTAALGGAPAAQGHAHGPRRPWPAGAVEALGRIAVQDAGRTKPLTTFSSFTLLRLAGKRSLALADGTRLAHLPWLLDVLLRPEEADHDPLFLVQDDAVVAALGIEHDGKRRRDRYAFEELAPALPRLFELAHRYGALEASERTGVQEQLVFLAENVNAYLGLRRALDFARARVRIGGSARLAELFDGRAHVGFAELLARVPALLALRRELGAAGADAERAAVEGVLRAADELGRTGDVLALIPPAAGVEQPSEWWSAGTLARAALRGEPLDPGALAALAALEALAGAREDPAAFERAARGLAEHLVAATQARGEYVAVARERAYYAARLLPRGLVAFVAAFLLLALSWLWPRGRWAARLGLAATVAGALLLGAAIVWRCVVRARPPVSTLYETLLFVTWVAVALSLAIEAIGRRRFALAAGAFLGMVGLFLASGYETLDKRDTMPSLVAVLDTNFWLATHVTAITIGYSAGMLAALLGSAWVVLRALGARRGDRAFYRSLSRATYGVLCFALIFSLVGTVLGGIWANESWGRFWGWDPKENGALLIVISQTAILHARLAGLLRERGLCVAAAFGGSVIAFSWWGVNLLGVGLHSYGFTSGIQRGLWTYYLLQWSVVGLGAFGGWRERASHRARRQAPPRASAEGAADLREAA